MDISKARCGSCNRPMRVAVMVCPDCGLRLEGDLEVSSLGRLALEDQVFVTAFVRHHGSIKRMEAVFGISYPTVKNRLNAIGAELDAALEPAPSHNHDVLERLARGEITVEAALQEMR